MAASSHHRAGLICVPWDTTRVADEQTTRASLMSFIEIPFAYLLQARRAKMPLPRERVGAERHHVGRSEATT